MKGQMYVRVDVQRAAALVGGATRAGELCVAVTAELLAGLSAAQREALAQFVTTDDHRPRCRTLVSDGVAPSDIREALIQRLAADAEREAAEAEAKARNEATAAKRRQVEEKEREEQVEMIRSLPIDALLVPPNPDWDRWQVSATLPGGTNILTLAGRIEEARSEMQRRNAERIARKEEERASWIETHGSERLKRLAAEKIECEAVYRDERLATDRPGWRWRSEVQGNRHEPRNAPQSALDLLDEARQSLPADLRPAAKLVYWQVSACEDDHYDDEECPGCHDGWRGYVIESELLGRDIVYGGPTE